MTRIFLCLLLLVVTCLRLAGGQAVTNTVPRLNPTNFLMRIEWNGAVTKSVWEAGWATTNRMAELGGWQAASPFFRRTATISNQEVLDLERAFSDVGGFIAGPWPIGIYTQEYVVEITSGTAQYHKELGFSKGNIPVLERVKTCLRPQAQPPLDNVIKQAEKWQR